MSAETLTYVGPAKGPRKVPTEVLRAINRRAARLVEARRLESGRDPEWFELVELVVDAVEGWGATWPAHLR